MTVKILPTTAQAIQHYQQAVTCCHVAGQMMAQYDFDFLLEAINRAETVTPITDPNLYREKIDAMKRDKEILKAARPLWLLFKKHQAPNVITPPTAPKKCG